MSNPAFLTTQLFLFNSINFFHQIFDCEIEIKTRWSPIKPQSHDFYDDENNYLSGKTSNNHRHIQNILLVALFDVNHGLRRDEDTITIELSNIPNQRMGRHENELLSRFFGKKRNFQLPKYDPNQVNGYLLNLDEIENWHSGFNVAVKINLKKWQKNDSIYLAFSQYTKVEPYHCNTGMNEQGGSSYEFKSPIVLFTKTDSVFFTHTFSQVQRWNVIKTFLILLDAFPNLCCLFSQKITLFVNSDLYLLHR